jgi:glycerophosphoryl diester phosphodiesterase
VARKVQVIAHRGAHENAPQNSLEAYKAAIGLGCDYIEVDLRTTASGQLVIKHDSLNDADVLPSLDDVLELAKGRIRIYLDVKQAMPAAIVTAVERHRMRDAILTYGNFQLQRDLVQLRPGWPCMPEAVDAATLQQNLSLLKPPAVAFGGWDFKPDLVRMAREAGCEIFLDRQGATDTPAHWQAALDAGATGIQTDRPTALIEWRRGDA